MLPAAASPRASSPGARPRSRTRGYLVPPFPDGAATYPTPDGGWILAVNTEVPAIGGASAIRFDAAGTITSAYRILENTNLNCAGGPTPWGTWLSCEEVDNGLVWECDPTGRQAPRLATAGAWARSSTRPCASTPTASGVYLSEDIGDGGLYRFTPDRVPRPLGRAARDRRGRRRRARSPGRRCPIRAAPRARRAARSPEHIVFQRGEGIWFDSGIVYLATTTRTRRSTPTTRAPASSMSSTAPTTPSDTPLRGVDNLHVSRSGDLFVAEDSYTNDPDAMDVCIITPDRVVSRFLKLTGPEHKLPGERSPRPSGLCLLSRTAAPLRRVPARVRASGDRRRDRRPFRPTPPTPAPTPGTPPGSTGARGLQLGVRSRRGLPVCFTLDRAGRTVDDHRARGQRASPMR